MTPAAIAALAIVGLLLVFVVGDDSTNDWWEPTSTGLGIGCLLVVGFSIVTGVMG